MTAHDANRIVLIGVGNPWRGDDGVGRVVVEAAAAGLVDAEVIESDGEPARLVDAWTGAGVAVVVDAVRSGAPPGTVHTWAGEAALPVAPASPGTHALGVAEAIALGRAVGRLPRRLVVVGIEAAETSAGQGLSPPVTDAVATAAEVVVASCRFEGGAGVGFDGLAGVEPG